MEPIHSKDLMDPVDSAPGSVVVVVADKVVVVSSCDTGDNRDAGAIWEDTYAGALMSMGFRRGDASPCNFVHDEKGMTLVVHGDDSTALGVGTRPSWPSTSNQR